MPKSSPDSAVSICIKVAPTVSLFGLNEDAPDSTRSCRPVGVTHGMSVIAVQAVAAQEIAPSNPDAAIELMQMIEATIEHCPDAGFETEFRVRGEEPALAHGLEHLDLS